MSNELDCKQFQVKLQGNLADEFEAVIAMTGMTKAAVVQQAIESYVARYENSDGVFAPKSGKYLRHMMENPDGTISGDEARCVVLDTCKMNGTDYAKIYEGGTVYKVPLKNVIIA